jgi:ligand-binding SRPBCC domain-containing protein
MSIHQYKTSQFLPISIEKAWSFFSSPKNLATITPPELQFKILTQLTENDIYPGMKINYIVKPILGIPLHWETEIDEVDSLKKFTDKQLKGPYKLWEHTHTFEKVDGGVLMNDIINYELPMGWLGDIAHTLFVKQKIERIFTFREKKLTQLFVANE